MNKKKDYYYLGKLLALLKPYKYYLAAIFLCLIASSAIVFLQPLLISRLPVGNEFFCNGKADASDLFADCCGADHIFSAILDVCPYP